MSDSPLRSGYVALIGRPNVGKSTLLNQLLGQKIAATTHKPQTTRKKLLGILEGPGAQILLLDTPGYHRARGPLNRFMVDEARAAIADADLVAYLVEARSDGKITPGNERLLTELSRAKKPVILLLNKIDLVKEKPALLAQLEVYAKALGDLLVEAIPISALTTSGLSRVVEALAKNLPAGPRYFEEGQLTDQPERAIVAEFIREKVMLETRDELPYSAAVTIEAFEDHRPRLVRIIASLYVERDSQKGIVIGRGGERLKAIGSRARKDIEYFLGSKVFLDLQVKVAESWSEDPRALARLGYVAEDGSLPSEDELGGDDGPVDDLADEPDPKPAS